VNRERVVGEQPREAPLAVLAERDEPQRRLVHDGEDLAPAAAREHLGIALGADRGQLVLGRVAEGGARAPRAARQAVARHQVAQLVARLVGHVGQAVAQVVEPVRERLDRDAGAVQTAEQPRRVQPLDVVDSLDREVDQPLRFVLEDLQPLGRAVAPYRDRPRGGGPAVRGEQPRRQRGREHEAVGQPVLALDQLGAGGEPEPLEPPQPALQQQRGVGVSGRDLQGVRVERLDEGGAGLGPRLELLRHLVRIVVAAEDRRRDLDLRTGGRGALAQRGHDSAERAAGHRAERVDQVRGGGDPIGERLRQVPHLGPAPERGRALGHAAAAVRLGPLRDRRRRVPGELLAERLQLREAQRLTRVDRLEGAAKVPGGQGVEHGGEDRARQAIGHPPQQLRPEVRFGVVRAVEPAGEQLGVGDRAVGDHVGQARRVRVVEGEPRPPLEAEQVPEHLEPHRRRCARQEGEIGRLAARGAGGDRVHERRLVARPLEQALDHPRAALGGGVGVGQERRPLLGVAQERRDDGVEPEVIDEPPVRRLARVQRERPRDAKVHVPPAAPHERAVHQRVEQHRRRRSRPAQRVHGVERGAPRDLRDRAPSQQLGKVIDGDAERLGGPALAGRRDQRGHVAPRHDEHVPAREPRPLAEERLALGRGRLLAEQREERVEPIPPRDDRALRLDRVHRLVRATRRGLVGPREVLVRLARREPRAGVGGGQPPGVREVHHQIDRDGRVGEIELGQAAFEVGVREPVRRDRPHLGGQLGVVGGAPHVGPRVEHQVRDARRRDLGGGEHGLGGGGPDVGVAVVERLDHRGHRDAPARAAQRADRRGAGPRVGVPQPRPQGADPRAARPRLATRERAEQRHDLVDVGVGVAQQLVQAQVVHGVADGKGRALGLGRGAKARAKAEARGTAAHGGSRFDPCWGRVPRGLGTRTPGAK